MPSITIYSDFTCPFSYATDCALLPALRPPDAPKPTWIGFQLHPELPDTGRVLPKNEAGRIWGGHRRLLAQWSLPVARRAPSAIPNTRLAHIGAEYARQADTLSDYVRLTYAAWWETTADLANSHVIYQLLRAAGAAPNASWATGAACARYDQQRAAAVAAGIRSTPTLLSDRTHYVGLPAEETLARLFSS